MISREDWAFTNRFTLFQMVYKNSKAQDIQISSYCYLKRLSTYDKNIIKIAMQSR